MPKAYEHKCKRKDEPEDPRRCKDCKLFEWALRVQTRKEDGHCKLNGSMRYHGDYICLHFEEK